MSSSRKRDRERHLAYQRGYERTPEQRERDAARHRAHAAANRRLRETYQGEFNRLYHEEMRAAGLVE